MLKVKTSKAPIIAIAVLGILLVPLELFFLVAGIITFNGVGIAIGLMGLVVFSLALGLFLWGYFKSVKHFTNDGLTRNDGRQFYWKELNRVAYQKSRMPIKTRSRSGSSLWRIEIQFRDGSSAWVIPAKILNFGEVSNFVDGLPCEHIREKVW